MSPPRERELKPFLRCTAHESSCSLAPIRYTISWLFSYNISADPSQATAFSCGPGPFTHESWVLNATFNVKNDLGSTFTGTVGSTVTSAQPIPSPTTTSSQTTSSQTPSQTPSSKSSADKSTVHGWLMGLSVLLLLFASM
jgi:hypothetical protein